MAQLFEGNLTSGGGGTLARPRRRELRPQIAPTVATGTTPTPGTPAPAPVQQAARGGVRPISTLAPTPAGVPGGEFAPGGPTPGGPTIGQGGPVPVSIATPQPPSVHPPAGGGTPPSVGVPPGTPQPAAPPAATPIQGFSAEDSLIGTQINPADNPRLQAVQAQLDKALQGLEGPDRAQIAKDVFQGLEEDFGEQREKGIRRISEKAGALGRIGSGGVTTELGTLEESIGKQRSRAMRELSAGAAGESLQDRLRALGGTADIESMLSAIGAGKRGEVRGERAYQRDVSQDPIRQRLLEEQLLGGEFDRYLRSGSLLGQLGQAPGGVAPAAATTASSGKPSGNIFQIARQMRDRVRS